MKTEYGSYCKIPTVVMLMTRGRSICWCYFAGRRGEIHYRRRSNTLPGVAVTVTTYKLKTDGWIPYDFSDIKNTDFYNDIMTRDLFLEYQVVNGFG